MSQKRLFLLGVAMFGCAALLLLTPAGAQQPAPSTPTAQIAPQAAPVVEAPIAPSLVQGIDVSSAADSGRSAKSPVGLHDLSPWSMFMSADIIVKGVMLGLAFASLVTWTVLIAKTIELSVAQRKLGRSLRRIRESRSLAEAQMALGKGNTVLSSFIAAALHEARLSSGLAVADGVKERAVSSFSDITRGEARAIRRGMGVLATIGSTSPFVGLFGTVWGIMNSFIGISKSQTTNLAVVAPGIAEALLATAIGLVAAIPAVIIYNHFSRATKAYLDQVGQASGASLRLLSRDLDRAHGVILARAAE